MTTTRRFLRAAALASAFMLAALATVPALALPTVQQVEAEVAKGRYAQAETMMGEVVAAKPGSARAHYVYAEILAHNELLAKAAEQARLARTLDPSLAFAGSPEKFRSFERALERAQGATTTSKAAPTIERSAPAIAPAPIEPRAAAAPPPITPQSSGIPSWLWGAGLAIVAVMLWRAMSRRSAATVAGSGASGAGVAAPYGNPGYGPSVTPPGMTPGGNVPGAFGAPAGGGLFGAGLAGAGGFAAGMMVDRLLHRNDGGIGGANAGNGNGIGGNGNGNDHLAGLGPDTSTRFADDPGLPDRSVDFGTGADDWGSDPGGSSDGGGGGDGGWDS